MGDAVSIKEVHSATGRDTYQELENISLHEVVMRLHPSLVNFQQCKELCHVGDLFNVQRALLQCCLGKGDDWHKDCLLISSTGSGKTLAFLLLVIHKVLYKLEALEDPSLHRPRDYLPTDPHCLIVVPSRELAIQIHDVARALTRNNDVWIRVIFGGFSRVELSGRKDIIVCTPGRLLDHIERGDLMLGSIDTLVMDECDRLMGIEFSEQVKAIARACPPREMRQTIMCTATIEGLYFQALDSFLKERHFLIIVNTQNSATHIILPSPEEPQQRYFLLLETLKHYACNKVLIFCKTVQECKNLQVSLHGDGFLVDSLYRHKVQQERLKALQDFGTGKIQILVGTDLAARGLDIPHISMVLQFDLPENERDFETYVHRSGRCGRAGAAGYSLSFFPLSPAGEGNCRVASKLCEFLREKGQDVPQWLEEVALQPVALRRPRGRGNVTSHASAHGAVGAPLGRGLAGSIPHRYAHGAPFLPREPGASLRPLPVLHRVSAGAGIGTGTGTGTGTGVSVGAGAGMGGHGVMGAMGPGPTPMQTARPAVVLNGAAPDFQHTPYLRAVKEPRGESGQEQSQSQGQGQGQSQGLQQASPLPPAGSPGGNTTASEGDVKIKGKNVRVPRTPPSSPAPTDDIPSSSHSHARNLIIPHPSAVRPPLVFISPHGAPPYMGQGPPFRRSPSQWQGHGQAGIGPQGQGQMGLQHNPPPGSLSTQQPLVPQNRTLLLTPDPEDLYPVVPFAAVCQMPLGFGLGLSQMPPMVPTGWRSSLNLPIIGGQIYSTQDGQWAGREGRPVVSP